METPKSGDIRGSGRLCIPFEDDLSCSGNTDSRVWRSRRHVFPSDWFVALWAVSACWHGGCIIRICFCLDVHIAFGDRLCNFGREVRMARVARTGDWEQVRRTASNDRHQR